MNLIGYSLFPYGWSWDEYDAKETFDLTLYEDEALKLSRGNIPLESVIDEQGLLNIQKAQRFRAALAKRHLKRFVVRNEVKYYLSRETTRDSFPMVDGVYQIDPYIEPVDLAELNITRSTVGRQNHWQTIIEIDAIELIDLVINQKESRGRKKDPQWAQIERVMRLNIERGKISDKGQLTALIQNDPNLAIAGGEPRLDTLRKEVIKLNTEYRFAK